MATHPSTLTYQPATAEPSLDREAVILEHLPQVRWIAARIHERLPQSTSLEDLISVGILGLIQAVDNFDPEFNVKRKTYAEFKIRGAILDSLRGMDGVSTYHRKKVKDIQTALRTLQNTLQRQPTEPEIAGHLQISLAEYHDWLLAVRGVAIGSLDAETDEGLSIGNTIADPSIPDPEEQLERAELTRLLRTSLDDLPEAEKVVLDLYFDKELTLRDIAKVMNLHATRIHQLKNQAILRLRAQLAASWPGPSGL